MRLIMKVNFSDLDSSYCEAFPILYHSTASDFLEELELSFMDAMDKRQKLSEQDQLMYAKFDNGAINKQEYYTYKTKIREDVEDVFIGDNKIPLDLITNKENGEFQAPEVYTVDEFFMNCSLSYKCLPEITS